MVFRGIQVIGLIIAALAQIMVYYLRRRGRLSSRSFLFWVGFWTIFTIMNAFPSLTGYITPYFTLRTNMYTLTAISILTLFVFVFSLFSYLSDLNWKINRMIRNQALNDWRKHHQVKYLKEKIHD